MRHTGAPSLFLPKTLGATVKTLPSWGTTGHLPRVLLGRAFVRHPVSLTCAGRRKVVKEESKGQTFPFPDRRLGWPRGPSTGALDGGCDDPLSRLLLSVDL